MLVRQAAGFERWERLERSLRDGTMTLRDVLSAQARFVHLSIDDADALLARTTRFDPTFAPFARRCEHEDAGLTILSSGIEPLIERALARNGLQRLCVRANTVEVAPSGWTMRFRDGSDNGHDKAAALAAAKATGAMTVFVGDGHSDFAAALQAHVRFAKRGLALERYLQENGVPFTPFSSFAQVEEALFTPV